MDYLIWTIWSWAEHYMHGRQQCGYSRHLALYRATYAQYTGKWPW